MHYTLFSVQAISYEAHYMYRQRTQHGLHIKSTLNYECETCKAKILIDTIYLGIMYVIWPPQHKLTFALALTVP